MTIGYGFFSVAGTQTLTDGRSQVLGPLTVPFGSAVDFINYTFGVQVTQGPQVPHGATGVWFMPVENNTNTGELSFSFDGTNYYPISPNAPSFIAFDPNNYPTGLSVTAQQLTLTIQYV